MGFWDFLSSNSPGGITSSTAKVVLDSTFEGVSNIIRDFKAPPEQVLAMEAKLAELKTNLQMKLEDVAASDRNSARQREMAVKDKMPAILSILFTAGFFGVLIYMMKYGAPAGAGSEAFILILGTLTSGVGLVLGYYFGSSSSSAMKNSIIGEIAKKP